MKLMLLVCSLVCALTGFSSSLAAREQAYGQTTDQAKFSDQLVLTGILDAQLHSSDGVNSWIDGGTGKLFYDDDDDSQLGIQGAGIKLDYDVNLSSKLHLVAHYFSEPEQRLEVTEAFWSYRPVSRESWRPSLKVGAFYPRLSLENIGPLWNSPFTLRPSVLNTWIGEELRTFGAEGTMTWRGDPAKRSPHRVSLTGALFWFNDPVGALISWRGWASHNRQTGLDGTLPLANIPFIASSDAQNPYAEPFLELDDNPGVYAAVRYSYKRKFSVQAFAYDNRTDDQAVERGQYGWHTQFGQLSVRWRLQPELTLLAQYLSGNTIMAVDMVDNDFEAGYLMLVKDYGAHRLAARAEIFEVTDNDSTFMDANDESGHSQTLSYSYFWRDRWKFSLEATQIKSDRRARMYFGERQEQTEYQFSLGLRYFFKTED